MFSGLAFKGVNFACHSSSMNSFMEAHILVCTFLKRERLHVFYFPFIGVDSKNLLVDQCFKLWWT